jgi:leader peptidase (prepilin peptidase)/N-methyltransferase
MLEHIGLFLSQHIIYYYVYVILIGLACGSFLNVVIYRLPIMMKQGFIQEINLFVSENQSHLSLTQTGITEKSVNLCFPRSFCPNCNHSLTWWQNIPLLSYLFLKSKCYYCHVRISPRYFFIEALTSLALFICAYHFGVTWQAFWAMIFSLALIAMTFIDLDHQLLPDSLTLPLLWLGLVLSLFGVFVYPNTAIIGACVGYLTLWSVYWAFKLITKKEGMGYGDFKLLAALGAWLGWQALPSVLLISALLGTIIGLSLRAINKLEAGQPIPFGPFLALAGWVSLIWGAPITQFYFNLFKI